MPIDGRTLPEGTPIYTHVDEQGKNTHIYAEGIRQWCLKVNRDPELTPIDFALAKTFVKDKSITKERLRELMRRLHQGGQLDPIIYCKDGTFTNGLPDVFLADGHHRFALYAALGRQFILAWVLETHEWEPYRVVNIQDHTHESLRDEAPRPRNY